MYITNLLLIDNYQGGECDIAIVSLTRSNDDHEIGFMSSPLRVNTLLTAARDVLVMIGNVETFRKSDSDDKFWGRLIDQLESKGRIYEGLPVRCERHSDQIALLSNPEDFEMKCPDGGCLEPWYVLLCLHPFSFVF